MSTVTDVNKDRTAANGVAGENGKVGAQLPPIEINREWLAEFEAAARRPLKTRLRYAFIRTYKPVLDDVDYRAFSTMAEYREWCERNLPAWLGYGR